MVELPPITRGAKHGNALHRYGAHQLGSQRGRGGSPRRRRDSLPGELLGPYDSPRRQLLLNSNDRGALSPARMTARDARRLDVDTAALHVFGDCSASRRVALELGHETYSAPFTCFFPEPFVPPAQQNQAPPRRRFLPDAVEAEQLPANLTALYKALCVRADPQGRLDRPSWISCLVGDIGVSDTALVDRVFVVFDRSEVGRVNVRTVMKALTALMKGPVAERVYRACFDLFAQHDGTEDGLITRRGLRTMRQARRESGGKERPMMLTLLSVFRRGDTDRPEFMTYDEFRDLLTSKSTGADALLPFTVVLFRVFEMQYHEGKNREQTREGGRHDRK